MAEQTPPERPSEQRSGARRPWLVISTALFLLLVIMGFLSALTYLQLGLPVFMADWQFGRFGQSLPIFNIVIFVTVAILLGLLVDFLIGLARRRRRDDADIDPADDPVEAGKRAAKAEAEAAIGSARRFLRLLTITGSVLVCSALAIALWALLLPRGAETVVFGNASGVQRTVQGRPDGRLMVTAVNDVLVYRDSAFFVPVIDPAQPRTIRQFVEFVPDGRWNGAAVPQVDVSRPFRAYRLALPAFTPTLYAGNGYKVVKPYEVLTNRPIAVQLPYFITAIQLALIGLIVLAVAFLQRRRVKRLQRDAQERAEP